jgi:integrase
MANITKALVERARPHEDGRHETFIWDDRLKGFGLRITDRGFKSFVWQGRIRGRSRRLTLGEWPILAVAQARVKWTDFKARVARGEDPFQEREAVRREPTFGELAAAYLKDAELRGLKTSRRSKQRLDASCAGWRGRRLADITRGDVAELHAKIAETRGQVVANRTVTLLRTIFNFAADRGLFKGENPAARVKLFRETQRERFLSADELGRVNAALAAEPSEYWRAYFAVLLMTGLRKNELLSARWADVDLTAKTLRLPVTKSGKQHLLPLPEPAVAILTGLPSRGSSEWIFPGAGKTGHLAEVKSAWLRIRQRAGVENVTVHDLRRTLGSWLAASGASLLLIGRALNHSSQRSTEIYARVNLDPVREALERNAVLMLGTQK